LREREREKEREKKRVLDIHDITKESLGQKFPSFESLRNYSGFGNFHFWAREREGERMKPIDRERERELCPCSDNH
jgi:hypothetical protein